MEENNISVFAALLGIAGAQATVDSVSAKINELKAQADKVAGLQKTLEETNAKLTEANAELTGAKTSVKNLTEDLENTKAALKVFQDAEIKAKEDKVNALIDKAIEDCKINKDEREDYIKMAQDNYDLAERILAKIPARDNIGEIVSKANTEEAKDGMKTEEQKVLEHVESVVGKDFKFRTLD